jgi:intracellular sulfur oxidation DsrE/DsrF family protein
MSRSSGNSERRRFLTSLAGAAALLGLPANAHAERFLDDSLKDGDAWMKPLKGKHRQFFHAMSFAEEPLRMSSNFLDAYRDAFGAASGEVNAVIGVHSGALNLGFDDALWSKYELGKSGNVTDPVTKAPAVRNIYAREGTYNVAKLQQRGIVFLMCNTALRNRATQMSSALNVPYETMYAELSAGRLPGVVLVPAMVVAINRAQEHGFTYIRAS